MRNFPVVFRIKLHHNLKEIEFQKSLSGQKSLREFKETNARSRTAELWI